MGEVTAITWCHHTFNPWWGCYKISPGCLHCYAAAFDKRLGGDNWKLGGPRRFFGDAHWRKPLGWARRAREGGERRRVFCASQADVFEDRPDLVEHRQRLFALIAATPELDWLLLTKRPENAAEFLPWLPGAPWPNVWLGVTAEDREHWDLRVPTLRATRAAVRFVSYEPALGPLGDVDLTGIDWLIAGDESGGKRRPAELAWIREARDRCTATGTRFHLKQLHHTDAAVAGQRDHRGKIHLPVLDGKQWGEFPR